MSNLRRIVLSLGLAGLVFSAAHRAPAATGEVEAEGYGGVSNGGWVCGPMGSVKYAGAGANMTIAERPITSPEGEGASVLVGASAESQRVTISCADCEQPSTVEDPARISYGVHTKVGYKGRYLGAQAGADVYTGLEQPTDKSLTAKVVPDFEVEGGKMKGDLVWYAVGGFGAPTVTTIQRPGGYFGGSVGTKTGYAVDLRLGAFRSGPATFDSTSERVDLGGRIPLVPGLQLKVGAGLGGSKYGVDPEANAGLAAKF